MRAESLGLGLFWRALVNDFPAHDAAGICASRARRGELAFDERFGVASGQVRIEQRVHDRPAVDSRGRGARLIELLLDLLKVIALNFVRATPGAAY